MLQSSCRQDCWNSASERTPRLPPAPLPAADLPVGTGQLLRSLSLLSLVTALAEEVPGVFVPYDGLRREAGGEHLPGKWTVVVGAGLHERLLAVEIASHELPGWGPIGRCVI